MLGYKGFNPDMTCMNKQYEVGKIYHEDRAVLCYMGMHFCTDPLDVLSYYSPRNNSRYCLVEAENVSDKEKSDDSKRVCKDLKIIKEFTRKEYYKEICKYHNSKDGIIKKDDFLYILSDNNIINMRYDDYTFCDVYGNNNIICDKMSDNIFDCGENNIILENEAILINNMCIYENIKMG